MAEMKSIKDSLQSWTNLQGEKPEETPRRLSNQTIENLFAKMLAIFGRKVSEQWAGVNLDQVKNTWAESLSELEDAEIIFGIRNMIRSGSPFPPTLPEFYAYCRPKINIPDGTDHKGLEALAAELGVRTGGFPTYNALRFALIEAASKHRQLPRLKALERT